MISDFNATNAGLSKAAAFSSGIKRTFMGMAYLGFYYVKGGE